MTLNNFSSGVNTTFTDELDENFSSLSKIQTVYESSGFDQSGTGSSTHEFTSFSSSDLAVSEYILIEGIFDYTTYVQDFDHAATIDLEIEAKEVGGTYSTIYNKSIVSRDKANGTTTDDVYEEIDGVVTPKFYHELTSGQKSNGIQFKFTTTISNGRDGGYASLTNVQTVFKKEA